MTENVQDLLEIKEQLLTLKSANNAFEFAIQQKDDMIEELKEKLERRGPPRSTTVDGLDPEERVAYLSAQN